MSDLISKLNVLIRATVNSPRGSDEHTDGSRSLPRAAAHLSDAAVDAQIAALRQHINAALDAEDTLRRKIENGQAEADQINQQIDAALQNGDGSTARVLVQRLQQQRQRLTSQQSDLDLHRRSTSELIEQVNQLEAQISDARAGQIADSPIAQAPAATPAEAAPSAAVRVPVNIRVNRPADPPPTTAPAAPAANTDNDDDLGRRRSRLSSPDRPDKIP